jgi:hypothetical protein
MDWIDYTDTDHNDEIYIQIVTNHLKQIERGYVPLCPFYT